MSLPRELHVVNDRLIGKPIKEVYDQLVGTPIQIDTANSTTSNVKQWSATCPNDSYYADITLNDDADFTLTIAENRNTNGSTPESLRLVRRDGVTRLATSGQGDFDKNTYDSGIHDVRHIEVFFDHQVAEVFLNDGEAAGTMLFQAGEPQVRMELDAQGNVTACKVNTLNTIW